MQVSKQSIIKYMIQDGAEKKLDLHPDKLIFPYALFYVHRIQISFHLLSTLRIFLINLSLSQTTQNSIIISNIQVLSTYIYTLLQYMSEPKNFYHVDSIVICLCAIVC